MLFREVSVPFRFSFHNVAIWSEGAVASPGLEASASGHVAIFYFLPPS
jgi:hypothetical protein